MNCPVIAQKAVLDRFGRKGTLDLLVSGVRMSVEVCRQNRDFEKSLAGQRIGSIRFDHAWDIVLVVIMDERFELRWIYEANRDAIEAALKAPGSKARNERGALSLPQFKRIGRQVWPVE